MKYERDSSSVPINHPFFVEAGFQIIRGCKMQRSTTHLDPFLFLSRCWSSMAWKAGSQPRHECFQQPVMRFSMDKPPEEMMQGCAGPLKSPSATNKGTIFCRNGIFQLFQADFHYASRRQILISQPTSLRGFVLTPPSQLSFTPPA